MRAYDPKDYPMLKRSLTAERIENVFPKRFAGTVTRYEMDRLCGSNFVMLDALEGGVNTSLNLDSHGKSFGYLILELPIAG